MKAPKFPNYKDIVNKKKEPKDDGRLSKEEWEAIISERQARRQES